MAIHYPDGRKFSQSALPTNARAKNNPVRYGKRGMTLEEDLNSSNEYYLHHGRAVIHKKPTPIQVVKVDYPKRSAAVIKEAYYRHSSTTDYNGVYRGYYLDFEAKETRNKTSFPLKNLHEHQIRHMDQCAAHGGLTFVIIRFSTLNRVFLLKGASLSHYWEESYLDGKKSIPLSYLEQSGIEIPYGFQPVLDYLPAVDQLIAESSSPKKEQ